MKNLPEMELYAWVGMDELGSGEIGIKSAIVPAGCIPIVATQREKIDTPRIRAQMDAMGKEYGTRISLCQFKYSEELDAVGHPVGER